jgi:5-methylthioadenosine/S-adenosylhomocysteine deaminase
MTHADSEHYDLLLRGAHLLTADPRQPLLRDAWLGVQAGRITWLDTTPPARATATRQMDLAGHVVTPGLVNPHTHSVLSMVRGVAADSGFAPSYTPGLPQGTQVNPEQARALARLGALEALLFGTTLLGDHFAQADASTEAMVDLGLRLAPSWRILDVDFSQVAQGRWVHDPAIGNHTLRGAMDLHARWRGHPRVMVNLAAHAVDTCSNGLLREVAALSAEHGLVVSTHLGQSQVEVQRVHQRSGKTSTEVLDEVGLLNPRLLAGHCIYLTEDDIGRIARAGAHAVHIPKCNATSGRMAPTPLLKRAGINLALATDTQHADMVELMRWALVTARLQEGHVDADWQPHHVLHMATLGGARALGLADRIGSLALGKQADLVVFDARRPHWVPLVDPLGNLVHCGQGRDVRHVVVDGELLVKDGQPTRVDMAEVCAEAETAARQLWGDAGRPYWEATASA